MTTSTLAAAFKALELACLAEGGDGDVVWVSPDHTGDAAQFEQWLKETENTWWTSTTWNGLVQFFNNQECIHFVPPTFDVASCYPSYVVQCRYGSTLLRS